VSKEFTVLLKLMSPRVPPLALIVIAFAANVTALLNRIAPPANVPVVPSAVTLALSVMPPAVAVNEIAPPFVVVPFEFITPRFNKLESSNVIYCHSLWLTR
jgi:hypothetical protein